MSLTEETRSELYGTLSELVGSNGAEYLMTQGPPGGWEQYPTNTDLQALATKMAAGFNEATTERKILRTNMTAGFAAAETDRKNIRTDMTAGFAAAETDRKNIRTDMTAGFAAAETDRKNIRTEMNAGFTAAEADRNTIRAEMTAGFAETNAKIDGLGSDVKTEIAKLAGTRSRDVWAFTATVAVLALMFTVAVIIGA